MFTFVIRLAVFLNLNFITGMHLDNVCFNYCINDQLNIHNSTIAMIKIVNKKVLIATNSKYCKMLHHGRANGDSADRTFSTRE